jgi:hypothetical protein
MKLRQWLVVILLIPAFIFLSSISIWRSFEFDGKKKQSKQILVDSKKLNKNIK